MENYGLMLVHLESERLQKQAKKENFLFIRHSRAEHLPLKLHNYRQRLIIDIKIKEEHYRRELGSKMID